MRISRPGYVAAGLLLGTVLSLTACGQERTGPAAPSPAGPARGNVEPGSHDGAPHYRENNGFKVPKDMSPSSEAAARTEAARIEPVIKRLWAAGTWDAGSVRTALLELGYRDEGPDSERGRGTLFVRANTAGNPGAGIALDIRHDACVTAFVQSTNYQVEVNGRFLETGCFEPRGGH
jgi:hypothetical protein